MHILRVGFLALIFNRKNGRYKGCTESVYIVLGFLFMVNLSNESRQSEANTAQILGVKMPNSNPFQLF